MPTKAMFKAALLSIALAAVIRKVAPPSIKRHL